jgi:hypothetical protein
LCQIDTHVAIEAQNSPEEHCTKINFNLLKDLLAKSCWDDVYANDNINEAYRIFMEILTSCISKASYSINSRRKHSFLKPWMTHALCNRIAWRNLLFKKMRKRPECRKLERCYISFKKRLDSDIKMCKENYYKHLFERNAGNSTNQWRILNSITGGKPKDENITKIRSLNNVQILTNTQEIVDEFTSHFERIIKSNDVDADTNYNACGDDVYGFPGYSVRESLFFVPTHEAEIKSIISHLKPKKSMGIDNISSYVIKEVSDTITKVFTYIANLSLQTGIFPQQLKTAIVIPIFKKGDRLDLNNYRPISLLPVFSKILEKIVKSRLLCFLNAHKFFNRNQFGFQKGKCTEDALLQFCSQIYDGLNNSNKVAGLFIDITKAFDSVNHQLLLRRLKYAGIRGVPYNWFYSYLSCRYQCVRMNNYTGQGTKLTCGVPQGSVLGPLLFLIYVNDLCNGNFNGKLTSFADDTALCYSATNVKVLQQLMQTDLDKFKYWFSGNCMKLSNKTKYVIFNLKYLSNEHNNLYYKCTKCFNNRIASCKECTLIERVSHIKYLGITIDEQLNWKNHINKLKSEMLSVVRKFYLLRYLCPVSTIRAAYYAFVDSRLQYGIVCWGGAYSTNINPLKIAQKKVIRVMSRVSASTHTFPLFRNFNILPLRHLFIYKVLKMFYNRSGESLKPRAYAFRSIHNLLIPRPKKELYRQSFNYLGPKIFSSLPSDLTEVRSEFKFTKLVRNWLFQTSEVEFMLAYMK